AFDLQRGHRQRKLQQRQRASDFRAGACLSSETGPAVPQRQLDPPDHFSPRVQTPELVDRGKQIAAAIARERYAANMIPEPLVTDCEAAALCLNLRRVGERGAPQLSQVVVIRVDHAVSRHGYEFAAEWMQAEPVKLVGQGRFIAEL